LKLENLYRYIHKLIGLYNETPLTKAEADSSSLPAQEPAIDIMEVKRLFAETLKKSFYEK